MGETGNGAWADELASECADLEPDPQLEVGEAFFHALLRVGATNEWRIDRNRPQRVHRGPALLLVRAAAGLCAGERPADDRADDGAGEERGHGGVEWGKGETGGGLVPRDGGKGQGEEDEEFGGDHRGEGDAASKNDRV